MSSIITDTRAEAALVLADGTLLRGRSIGASGTVTAEVVFNTSMTGYQEILTDPSYTGQLVTLTYPHIGNVGTNAQDAESERVCAAGLIVRCASAMASNFRSTQDLTALLKCQGVVGISDIDTRRLTRILRTKGAQAGCLTVAANDRLTTEEIEQALQNAQAWGSMVGRDLAQGVSCKQPYEWREGSWKLDAGDGVPGFTRPEHLLYRVVAYDFGIKRNILRLMVDRSMAVTVVPAATPIEQVLAMNPDGVFLSNGPGDPEPCTYAIEAARVCMQRKIPLFGICLGHQIMGLASGGQTVKMKFGHHGGNHPVQQQSDKRVFITAQNHGFAVSESSLPGNVQVTHRSLFDGSVQGLERTDAPAFSFQGHPEASPGPHDIDGLFDRFVEMMRSAKHV